MSYTNGLDKPSDYFTTKLYSGNGGTQSITGLDFQPDWVWIKQRNAAQSHVLIDSVRGVLKRLRSDQSDAEDTKANSLTAFGTDGFTLGSAYEVNDNSDTYVAWNWKAGGSASSNSNGSITSSVSANTDAGFSIVSFTGNATAGATIGHGLGSVPSLILTKNRDSAYNWHLWTHAFSSYNDTIQLNTTAAKDTGTLLNNTAPTSSLITLGNSAVLNASGEKIIAYVFAEKQGFSKAFSYTGNGNSDGSYCHLGFKASFILGKNSANGSENWFTFDNKRDSYNTVYKNLAPNSSVVEGTNTSQNIDILSNGFKCRSAETRFNGSGNKIIGIAFAENPFVSSTGVPACAR